MSELPPRGDLISRGFVLARLPADVQPILRAAAALAERSGWQLYLVGGCVRDALMNRTPKDLDLTVEGDALALASDLASQASVPVELNDRFGTATLDGPGGSYHLDVVRARRETYPTPGALPVVEPGTLADDLARRDFSINAMAIPLTVGGGAPLLDPHGGYDDLLAGQIEVLHDGSFIDDPTRLFRAVRFAERFEFRIAPVTLELVLQAVRDGAMQTVSVVRLSRELLLTLEESRAGRMLASLDKLGILSALHPGLYWPYPPDDVLIPEDEPLSRDERRDSYLAALGAEYAGHPEEAEQLAQYLRLTAPQVRIMREAAVLAAIWPHLSDPDLANSRLRNLLAPLDVETLQAFTRIRKLSDDTVAWDRLHVYLNELRHVRAHLNGDDLRAIGIPQGPIYKELLQELLEARLDGKVESQEEEERFVRERLAELQE